ncbi:uncharacterized protein TM35_000201790 [Trypanosoma theileri]|uniref:G-patch domain-containing protein n=1 Tax=Trypanosoma theileri TaxID=67003 RepID=A0A1X0NUI8_9TRYP|nr:uncharacterized protein TM35_000201790 [Trypanosoma theileri]ORC87770.1 hypothetical protein TM35_000201790 [Trypanosoma theileri]
MSSIAKKMLERHGWQEGMGLGRNAQGVSTYIKVVRRDPKSTTGLGHAADATQAPQASTFAVELDAVYSDISAATGKQKKVKKNKEKEEEEEDTDEVVDTPNDSQKRKNGNDQKNRKQKRPRDSDSSCSETGSSNNNNNNSDSSSDSDSDDDHRVDITRMTDEELLRRCGGVRLGRAGRHRFFEGKLRRIEESHRGQK